MTPAIIRTANNSSVAAWFTADGALGMLAPYQLRILARDTTWRRDAEAEG